jgi:hypothetical protein
MESTRNLQHEDIKGWGADLDPANRPAYPKERIPARNTGVHWDKLDQQVQNVRVYHSTERPGITPVFGTSTPPMGVSGKMRDIAFKFSENDIRHWMILLMADRINVVEGLVDDLRKGYIPNIFKEMGWGAELKHNRAGFMKKAAVSVGLLSLGIVLLQRRRSAKAHKFVHSLKPLGSDY